MGQRRHSSLYMAQHPTPPGEQCNINEWRQQQWADINN
jgi:hypothetical protein